LPHVHLKAISDASPERLAAVAEELNVQETYQDGHDMIENAGLDAVIIALPNHLHAEYSIKALRKGLHVLVEKPIASTDLSAPVGG
jgi:predicted dehydrogenase